MTSLDTIFNFAKFQYIEKYWVKNVPTDYPADATVDFSTQYDSEDTRQAVLTMEASLGTDESVVTEALPEDTYVSEYLGTFDVESRVDEEGNTIPLGRILLSPVQVQNSDAVDGVVALHYNEDNSTWENIEDAAIEDGYVYGTVESLSPIAVFTYRKDLEVKEGYLWKGLVGVYANGNPVRVYTTEEGKKVIENKITGKQYELTDKDTVLFGGTSDGTPLETTSISVEAGEYPKLSIKCGSQSPDVVTTLGTANVVVNDAKLGSVTGSSGKVHTDVVNITLNNTELSWTGAGESITYLASGNKDANADYTPETVATLNAPFYTKKVNVKFNNVKTQLGYVAANTGMTYTQEVNAEIKGGEIEYILLCASNGHTGSVVATVEGVKGTILQTNNRGIVDSVKATIKDCEITNLFVAGDDTDSTVTGITNLINLDIGKGTYKLIPGTQSGVEMTADVAAQTVGKVKYSRSADIEFADNTKSVLGDKLVLK